MALIASEQSGDPEPDMRSAEAVGAFQATLGPQFAVNANDIRFLKALRINVDEAH